MWNDWVCTKKMLSVSLRGMKKAIGELKQSRVSFPLTWVLFWIASIKARKRLSYVVAISLFVDYVLKYALGEIVFMQFWHSCVAE